MTVTGRSNPASASRIGFGSERAFAVRQVLRLVAVRELNVREVDVERAPGSITASAFASASANGSLLVNAPSVGCVHVGESRSPGAPSAGATRSRRTSSIEPSSRTRPITSMPNGTAWSLPSSRSRSSPSCSTTASSGVLTCATEQKAGVKNDDFGPGALRDPGRVVEHADRHVQLLPLARRAP